MSRILLLGNAMASSSNYDDDDGNKNIRKATGLICKKKALNVQQTFWPISLPSPYTD